MRDFPFEAMIWLVIATLNAYTAFMSWRAHRIASENSTKIEQIEVATNSMKDALVKATGEAAHAAGVKEGRAERS
jgi:hypothetical protein